MIWDRRHECMLREEIEQLQLERPPVDPESGLSERLLL